MSSTFLGLTACPYILLSALCRLPLVVPTSRQLPLVLSTIPSGRKYYQSLEHLRSLEYHATSNSVSTIPPRIYYSTFYYLCVDYSFVSATSPRVDYLLMSTTPYINILRKYSVLFKISSISGLWTADTWAMSGDAQLCDSGQWTPRDRRWQFWRCIPEV